MKRSFTSLLTRQKASKTSKIGADKFLDSKPFLAFGRVLHARSGSKISRIFRELFEHKSIKKFFGTNLAFALLAAGAIPAVTPQIAQIDLNLNSAQIDFQTEAATRYPVDKIKITQGYWGYHPGIDLDGITGDPVYSIKQGVVKTIEYARFGYGNNIIVAHGSELSTLYAHLSEIDVVEGQLVDKYTPIGKMGATGRAFGDHLHFEAYDSEGRTINPFSVLPR